MRSADSCLDCIPSKERTSRKPSARFIYPTRWTPRWVGAGQSSVERTCAEQGVPVKLSDPVALRRLADILGEAP